MNPIVELNQVSKHYQQGTVTVRALDKVSLRVEKRQFVAIMGASGSGKSTLLHLIGCLTTPTSGDIRINGQATHQLNDDQLTRFRREHIGFIFQSFNLLPTLTAEENVALPALISGQTSATQRARDLLGLVGMSDRLHHFPDELSGGQQQRVAIARALMTDGALLLADEPTGNLDSKTGETILTLMRELVSNEGRTVVMVTHDPKAAAYADRVITLSDGQVIEELAQNATIRG